MTNFKYSDSTNTAVFRIRDDGSYEAWLVDSDFYRSWQDAGGVPEPADPPLVVVPQQVTMRQARMALLQQGLLQTVNSAVASMTGSQGAAAQIEWEFSSTVERDRPLVQGLALKLGLSGAQLDALFTLAATL